MEYNNNAVDEVRMVMLSNGIEPHMITVEMICEHAIDQRLTQSLVLDMLSYAYGIYEDIAANGNDANTRQIAVAEMNDFEDAINVLDGSDFDEMLHVLSPTDDPLAMQRLTPESSVIDAPLTPPPLRRTLDFTSEDEGYGISTPEYSSQVISPIIGVEYM